MKDHLLRSNSTREEQVEAENKLLGDGKRKLRLEFTNSLPEKIYTGIDIKATDLTSIGIRLVDGSGQVFTCGPEAFSTIQIVALRGDEGPLLNWTAEEFNKRIIPFWGENKKPLLVGELQLQLYQGIGSVGKIKFRHCRDWKAQGKLMLGARDVTNFTRFQIQEAITKPFKLTDLRNGNYCKLDTLTMEDEVYRLKNISHRGNMYPRLKKEHIYNMKDFLHWLFKEPAKLELMMGLSRKKFEETIKHAQMGMINGKICCYSELNGKMTVVFDFVSQVLGVVLGGQYYHFQGLSDEYKAYAQDLAIHALQHWTGVYFVDSTDAMLKVIEDVLLSDDINSTPENHSACTIEVMMEEYHQVLIEEAPLKCSKPWIFFMISVLIWKGVMKNNASTNLKNNTSTKRDYPIPEVSTIGKKQKMC